MSTFLRAFLMGLDDRAVMIGVCGAEMGAEKRHGTIHSVGADNRVEQIDFTADYPNRLKRPNEEQILGLVKQARALGYNPMQLEIQIGNRRRVFDVETGKTVYEAIH